MIALDSFPATNPDIYYVILDGYGSASMLKELYGFDNSDFVHSLEERGFVVPENSLSNYSKTVLSVTSTLNMEYVQAFAPGIEDSLFWWLMVPWLDHSRVRNSLDGIGYKSVSISSDWSITDNPTTDVYFKSHPLILSDFERYLFGVTPLKMFQPLIADFSSVSTFNMHRRSQINNFDSLVESVHIDGPKFVFAHIILPHPPFVFASDGTPIDPNYSFSFNDASDFEGTDLEYRDLYIGQMQFLNDKLEVVVDSILQNSTRPVIIILQADHGPGMLTDFASASNTCLKERFSNFSAYYVPMIDKSAIPDDITPVNLFRIIFNGYFGTSLPLLENANYYPRQALTVYELEDVTSILDRRENCSIK
ncbi:MAG: sulfatase-like hydrolase/transferase [Chloroflexota bacterium]